MDNIERRDREMAYISDDAVMEEQKVCRRILQNLTRWTGRISTRSVRS